MKWYNEFRAYARAFGKDEVAAILLRKEGKEWLVWPEQTVEGLTFTLTANGILDAVPVDDLQHVVGWVHSHPMGMTPTPSGTDKKQVRDAAKDLAGNVAEMWIFGGSDYSDMSVTSAVYVDGTAFVSDTKEFYIPAPPTEWDDAAKAFHEASRRKPSTSAMPTYADWYARHAWEDEEDEDEYLHDYKAGKYDCPWCLKIGVTDAYGSLCGECDYEGMAVDLIDGIGFFG